MKLPNGYGSITKLSGKRRNPWRVRKTNGWEINEKSGKLIQKFINIGCYKTKAEALQMLADYNSDPYDLHLSTITLKEVYDKWSDKKYEEISHSNVNGYKAAWRLCESIQDMKFIDIKIDFIQSVADKSGKNKPTLKKFKVLMKALFDYAVIHDIITKDRNIVEYLDISKAGNPDAYDRKPFSKIEVQKVWNSVEPNEYISIILILIYTGLRISELLDLKKENVHLNERWFDVIESKTKSGIRKVPIAMKVLPLFKKWMTKNNCEYLLSTPDQNKFEYRNYYDSYWTPLIDMLNLKHKPHDARHTCVSLLTMAGVDERLIKKIVGHKGSGVTEATYTHIEIKELIKAIDKI